MARHIEITVDKWPVGPQTSVASRGDKFLIDEVAAHILVGLGKAKYLDEDEQQLESREMKTEGKRRYRRRDMRAQD